MMRLILAAVLLFGTSSAIALDEFKWKDGCDQNQSTMNRCSEERFKHYDGILNKLYHQQINYLLRNKKNNQYKKETGQRIDEAGNQLKAAQKAWLNFRDSDCLYQTGSPEDGGTMWPLRHFSCLAGKTKRRAIELEEYVSCRETECPM